MNVEMIPVASKLFKSYGYDPEKKDLVVEFNNGKRYAYHGVPPELVREMHEAESKGSFFSTRIRGAFQFSQIEQEATDADKG